MIWKELALSRFKEMTWHLHGEIEKYDENLQKG
jgi:hypothetical protein